MFAWLLNLIYVALLAMVLPYRFIVRRKGIAGWRHRFLGQVPRRHGDGPCLWLHAVSVGEVMQLQPVLEALTSRRPELELVISTTTPTGFDVACRRYPGRTVFYFPLDFTWAVNAALSRVNPTAIALVELELWPNFVFAAARRQIPVALINGRISGRSYNGYRRIFPVMRAMLRRIGVLAVQSEDYARRLIELGADPARVHVTGSIKFDGVETNRANPRTLALRQDFGLRADDVVFIAGSTQDPEERYAIESYVRLRQKHSRLRLILVPRHKERFEEVAHLVTHEYKLPLLRRSRVKASPCLPLSVSPGSVLKKGTVPLNGIDLPQEIGSLERDSPLFQRPASLASTAESTPHVAANSPHQDTPPILLLDTLGELSACWGLASIAFVGGSLTQRGGQNMIEPAGYGAAVLFGPNTWNFKDVVELLISHEVALVVRSNAELTARLEELLADPTRAAAMGDRARDLVTAQRGATARTVELLERVLLPEREIRSPQAA